ncbi:M10 family metallopeptidase [Microvirga terricola]|uniref:Peptidase metallopeptidase domain-containing protein n=1 Tax=Microvirga terricola TaxID=2719797 RepID=A0ABX0VFE1_9HYPH|nr:M10 family metallopeptidase [Microvirga terricola]NIX77400.1 hypothetical protein [Microvirga terricola]
MCYACVAEAQGGSWASFDPYSYGDQAEDPSQAYAEEAWNLAGHSSPVWYSSVWSWFSNNVSAAPLWGFSAAATLLPYTSFGRSKYYAPTYIDRDTLSVFSGSQWNNNKLTYSFTDSRWDYEWINPSASGFTPVSFGTEQSIRHILEGYSPNYDRPRMGLTSVESFTNLTIDYAGRDGADLQVAGFNPGQIINRSHGYYPGVPVYGGDLWLQYGKDDPLPGSYQYFLFLHEMGHTLGMKHSHEAAGVLPAMSSWHDSTEYTVMSYNDQGMYPQTYMMYDIAALQEMYGADFTTNSGNTVYKWNPYNGETYVNGVSQGATKDSKIFLTVWDGGGVDTYDFSAYTGYTEVDLAPGGYSMFSPYQRAQKSGFAGYAGGNVYNALQYHGDSRSLIENAIGGSWADHIRGNQANNMLTGNAGNDSLFGLDGNDTLYGGVGDDLLDDKSPWANSTYVYGKDLMDGGAGNDRIYGRFGNDTLYGGDGNDTIDAGEDNDLIYGGAGHDYVVGGTGADSIYGDAGNDILYGQSGNDTLDGGLGNDTVDGGDHDDIVYGRDGNDLILGGGGQDYLFGMEGNDTVYGGDGNDYIYGYTGTDALFGDAGDDILIADGYGSRLTGGTGNDTFWIINSAQSAVITDFAAGWGVTDRVQFSSSLFSSFFAVMASAYQSGTDVVIAKDGMSVTLSNMLLSKLVADDFAFI